MRYPPPRFGDWIRQVVTASEMGGILMVELNRDISVSPFEVGGRYAPQDSQCANPNFDCANSVGVLLVVAGHAIKILAFAAVLALVPTLGTGSGSASRFDVDNVNTVQLAQEFDALVYLPNDPRSNPFAKPVLSRNVLNVNA